ncbi:unnamed protein product [Oncorhynchus mykiss]|uniref:SID1 transmembrane family member 2 n=1 Tax=Oncorhynchus mykiss TaxID=8022 RepID=A0A060ZAZ7_ONCMY|nr:unnamed protein product [Oncorhynchus mykiss]
MGTALMMEGLLSACYHVCPNYTNFQFDTSFMYMIAGLCVLKLYQKRHPDINASAYTAYACLAAVIFFSVLGVVFGKGNMVFWIIFSVLHILATMLLSTQLYYMGRWRLDSGILRRIVYVIYTDCIRQCSGPMYIVSIHQGRTTAHLLKPRRFKADRSIVYINRIPQYSEWKNINLCVKKQKKMFRRQSWLQ